jgi:putative PIN family toxin of toxin-antitoxin system
MIKAVLDTNVVVSAHLSPEGPTALILDLAFSRFFRCVVSSDLLDEYEGVLWRRRFGLDPADVARCIRILRKRAILVTPRKKLSVTSDPDDDKVLECALEGKADYVVTGNTRHFPAQFRGIRIIPSRQFLIILASEPS